MTEISKAVCNSQWASVTVVNGGCSREECEIARLVVGRNPVVEVEGGAVVACEALAMALENARIRALKKMPKWRRLIIENFESTKK